MTTRRSKRNDETDTNDDARLSRRDSNSAGPPWIIIGAVVIAMIMIAVPFVMNREPEKKTVVKQQPKETITTVTIEQFKNVGKHPDSWGPVKKGMTMAQVRNLKLGDIFGAASEPATAYKDKETWIYKVDSGRGGIFNEAPGANLRVIFRASTGQVEYVITPYQTVWKEGKPVGKEAITYDKLVQQAKELGIK